SDNELGTVSRLVSKAEELELHRVFKSMSMNGFEVLRPLNRSLFDFGHNYVDVQGWIHMAQTPKAQLPSILRYIIESHQITTIQIDINKMYFNCHLIVLQVYSEFFFMLKDIPLLITLPEDRVSQKAFMLIYKWMLSDDPYLERAHIVEIFVAATYLRINDLLVHCWKYFDDFKCFNEDTACILYVEAQRNPALDVVRNIMLTRIHKFLLTFVASSDFLNIPVSHLVYLLSSSKISVNTEAEVFFIAVRWMSYDWQERKNYAQRIFPCIRFMLMPLWYILFLRRYETNTYIKELIAMDDYSNEINDAMATISTLIYEEREEHLPETTGDIFKRKGAEQRNWICDKNCNYFHYVGCEKAREMCYEKFEEYLSDIQRCSNDHWDNVEMLDPSNPQKCC
ncbi:hypothetical protein KR074_010069, partial [Drosophila pseudoananassae]